MKIKLVFIENNFLKISFLYFILINENDCIFFAFSNEKWLQKYVEKYMQEVQE